MPNYDKEKTRINAINMLSLLAMDDGPFASPVEEMAHLARKTTELSATSSYTCSHFLELPIKDQIAMSRLAVILAEVQYDIAKRNGFEEDEDGTCD